MSTNSGGNNERNNDRQLMSCCTCFYGFSLPHVQLCIDCLSSLQDNNRKLSKRLCWMIKFQAIVWWSQIMPNMEQEWQLKFFVCNLLYLFVESLGGPENFWEFEHFWKVRSFGHRCQFFFRHVGEIRSLF